MAVAALLVGANAAGSSVGCRGRGVEYPADFGG